MKSYTEEWTVVVNKTKYPLNEKQANILREKIAQGSRGIVVFDDFSISIPFIEEFYLSDKIYDVLPEINSTNEQKITEEERQRTRDLIEEFKKRFFDKHKVKQPLTPEEINTRRNELLDQVNEE